MNVLPISEARRRLPELVRKVAAGHAPVAIGRRGRCEAMLAAAGVARGAIARKPLQGLIEILDSWEDVERTQADIRANLGESLDRTARLISGKASPSTEPRRRRG